MKVRSFYPLGMRQMVGTFCLGLILSSNPSSALPDDRSQPIRIVADSATREEQASVTRYRGNVELSQGSLRITADLIIVNEKEDDSVVIIATGAPATMQQTPAVGEEPVNATAGKITYTRSTDRLSLSDSARIEQGGAVVTGPIIVYLVDEQRVLAASDQSGNGQRVEVIISPEMLDTGRSDEDTL